MAEDDTLVWRRSFKERGRQRYGGLLLAVVLAFAIEGIAEPGRWEQLLICILLGTTLLLAVWVAEPRPGVMRAVMILVALIVALGAVEALRGSVDPRSTRIASALLVVLAPPAIVIGLIRGLRVTEAVTVEAVLGVICIYLLIGMFFAFVFGAIDHVGGTPFFAQNVPATSARTLYFSFTTLATLGYGDYTARSNLGHTLSVFEALIGQLYLVTVVALIVTNLRRRPDG